MLNNPILVSYKIKHNLSTTGHPGYCKTWIWVKTNCRNTTSVVKIAVLIAICIENNLAGLVNWCIVMIGKGGNWGLAVLCLVGAGEEEAVLSSHVGHSIGDGMLKCLLVHSGAWNFRVWTWESWGPGFEAGWYRSVGSLVGVFIIPGAGAVPRSKW